MATPDEVKKQKELNDLLEQENRILKEKLRLQSDSYDLSSTLLEDLKETLGIRSKLTTYEKGVYDINKQINRTIRDQKIEFNGVNDITKQIKKNSDLLNKSKLFEQGLEKSLSDYQKKKAEGYLKNVNIAEKINRKIQEELNKAEKGEKVNNNKINGLKGSLNVINKTLQSEERSLGILAKQYVLTKKQREELDKQNKAREKEEKSLKEAQKRLGIFGGAMKGLSKIRILQDLGVDFEKINKDALDTTKSTKSGIEGLKAGLRSLGNELKDVLTTPSNLLLYVMLQIGKAIIDVDKQTGALAKGFNITYSEANDLRKELYQMAKDSGDLTANTRAYQETILAVGKALGSNAVLNKKDLQTFTALREKAGLTNDELNEQQKLAYVSGQYLEDNVGSLLASAKMTGLNNKMLLNEKDLLRDVSNTSNAIKLSLGGYGKPLGAAVAQVKILGMNMQQVENIAGSLLNFESSISAELEAELLTGKNLNLEMARLYAINNDMAGVAREIRKNYGSIEEFGRMNRLQQDAAAKAVGMTREELAKTLTDEKALAGLNGEKRNAAQAALEFARARGMTEEQIRKTEIKDLQDQMSVQEKLNSSIEKFKEAFVNIAQVILPIVEGFANLVAYIAKSKAGLFALQSAITAIAIASVASAVGSIFTSFGPLGIVGIGLAAVATTAMLTAISSAQSDVKKSIPNAGDMYSADGVTTVSTAEGGLFNLSPNDEFAAHPDLGNIIAGNNRKKSTPDAYWGEQLTNMSNQVSALTANVTKMSQQPIYVSAKVDDKELLQITANRVNERSTLERRDAFKIA
jgi:hemerythrin-like domain-containing protein